VDVTEYRQDIDRIPTEAAIRLIAVAQFAKWHGYDRLIEGLYEYYKNSYYLYYKKPILILLSF